MIIIRLSGGLGNQLFQYAFGRTLALRHSSPLFIDIEFYKNHPDRYFSLEHFAVQASIAEKKDILQFKSPHVLSRKIARTYNSLLPLHKKKYITERPFIFTERFNAISDNVYLDGYWQNEKYFLEHEKLLKHELVLKKPLSSLAQTVKNNITTTNAVSIHIRRGDYTTDSNRSTYEVCSPDYFARAIAYIQTKVQHPHFFVFSDDIKWVTKNIALPSSHTLVSPDLIPDYEALMLMSACNHAIISNSTFSWWGAWLISNTEKIIISPKQWLREGIDPIESIVPASWTKI